MVGMLTKSCEICGTSFQTKYNYQYVCYNLECKKERKRRTAILKNKNRVKETKVEILYVELLCLKCDQPFRSWDKKLNRICYKCKRGNTEWLNSHTEEMLYLTAINE
jgi:lysyl-tRNA synthetase class I